MLCLIVLIIFLIFCSVQGNVFCVSDSVSVLFLKTVASRKGMFGFFLATSEGQIPIITSNASNSTSNIRRGIGCFHARRRLNKSSYGLVY